jgi:hypothetical protein
MSEDTTKYVDSCFYIQELVPKSGRPFPKISMAEAAHIRVGIARALGMMDEEMVEKLAEFYKSQKEIQR